MIKGIPNPSDGRFKYNISKFINLISIAIIVYELDKTVNKKEPKILFNYCSSLKEYKTSLKSFYSLSTSELECTLNENSNKFDNLYLIIQLITELETSKKQLSKKSDGTFSHNRMEFIDSSKSFFKKQFKASYFHDYFNEMDFYIHKMHSFLLQLKDIIEKTNQSEFIQSKYLLDNNEKTNEQKPLYFFENLFSRNGLLNLKSQFKPTVEDYQNYDIDYDESTETITYNHYNFDTETNTFSHSKSIKTFTEYFKSLLFYEFNNCRKKIDEHINGLKKESQIKLFIKMTLNDINYLALLIKYI